MANLVNLTIDGKAVAVPAGTSVLEAARAAGIEIPRLCYDPELTAVGACRLCLVEIEKMRGLPASCATPAAEGMVVRTQTERVINARKMVLDLMLASHPEDCLTCEKNGECLLQEYAYQYGVRKSSFVGAKRNYAKDDSNPFFERDPNKCILCGRCVRTCSEVQGIGAIDYAFRGFFAKVTTAYDVPLQDSPCVFCGNCVTVCPVGALTPKSRIGQGRSWEFERVQTICPYCGVGCAIELMVKDGRVVSVEPANGPANHNKLCVKGRFGQDFLNSKDRLTKPLIRRGGKDGQLEETTWEEALDLVAGKLASIRTQYGPEALAGLTSAKCTNEENYLMQKLVRTVFGNNNIDHCARLCHASTVAGLGESFGSAAMTNSIDEIAGTSLVIAIGSNTTEAHPVIGLQIKKAKRHGATLIVIDPRRIELAELADIHLQQKPGTDVAIINGLINSIIEQGLAKMDFVAERTENFETLKAAVAKYTPEAVEKISGVPADRLAEVARLYATAPTATIVYSMGITQHTTGTDNVQAIADLAMVAGQVGREHTGVDPLRGQNNVQGACDVGGLPDVYPGYQKVHLPENQAKFEAAWGVKLSAKPGLTVTEIMHAAHEGKIRGLYIMGENPMVSDPNITHVEEALRRLDFLVVQDIFLTETARLADVVLPAAAYAEKDGTFTNTERRIQRVRKAVEPPGEARADWEILVDVANRLGQNWFYSGPDKIMDELAALTPIYAGVSFERLDPPKGSPRSTVGAGLQWPVPAKDHPGTRFLHSGKFSRGRGQFLPIEFRPAAEETDDEYPLVLSTGRMLFHYHTGSMSRRSKGLDWVRPEGYVEIHPDTAGRLGVADGDFVRVTSRRGSVVTRAWVTDRTGPHVVFMPFHFAEAAANVLTTDAVDPKAKIPEFKVAAVKVEKTGEPAWAAARKHPTAQSDQAKAEVAAATPGAGSSGSGAGAGGARA